MQNELLLEEIATVLAAAEESDDPARLERVLTDGYAHALALEADRRRLQGRIGALAVSVGGGDVRARRELVDLVGLLERQDGALGRLRDELRSLRARYSAAVRVARPR